MAQEKGQYQGPSYWWWVLTVGLGIIGALIAWGLNRERHHYVANSMLLTGILVTVVEIVSLLF